MAIKQRRVIRFEYRGPGTRICLPQVLYLSSAGRVNLEGVQIAGATSSGRLPGWRQFDATLIRHLEVLAETFTDCDPDLDLTNRTRYRRIIAACGNVEG
jgi:hypothetical protein